MLIQWRASSQCSVSMSSPSRGRVAGFLERPPAMVITIRRLLLIFLRWSVYQETMNREDARQDRPGIVAATRGGDASVSMDAQADPTTASLEQAVLERIQQLMAGQTPQARREVELTDVSVVVSQVARIRSRWQVWESRVQAHRSRRQCSPEPD